MAKETQRQDRDEHTRVEGTSRSVDPMLDLPQIDPSRQADREKHLLKFLRHEDYHGIRRFLARPATRG